MILGDIFLGAHSGCLGRPYRFIFFKGCPLQILLGPFLNTLTHKWTELFTDAFKRCKKGTLT